MKNPKILIIDDSTAFLGLVKNELDRSGVHVLISSNHNKALDIIRDECPDLILLDLFLKEEQGFSLIKKLKSDNILKSIRIIVIVSEKNKLAVQKALKLGVSDYLTKPLNFKALKNKCLLGQ